MKGNESMNPEAKFAAIRAEIYTKYNLDCESVFCSITGKPIGCIFEEELEALCASLDSDISVAAEDLVLRSLASMRPSMRWNRMRTDTLDSMRVAAPVETMAYLLNRLFTPLKEDKGYDWKQLHLDRIHLFAALDCAWFDNTPTNPSAEVEADVKWHQTFDSVMLMLLEIEAKMGLLTLRAPFKCSALLESPNLLENLHFLLKPWHEKRIEEYCKAELEAKFFASNPGAKRAFAKQWFETAPKSEATVKREAKQKDLNVFASILDELLGDNHKPASQRLNPDEVAELVKPSASTKLSAKMPTRFGVKKAGA
jgi:hypothetical protein